MVYTTRIKSAVKALLQQSPRMATVLQRWSFARRYRRASTSPNSGRLRDAWMDDGIPVQQREGVERELAAYRSGARVAVFDALVDVLDDNIPRLAGRSLLEVGCSSGYYSEVLRIANLEVAYSGCDYSKAFVTMARAMYPGVQFDVQDATALSYGDHSFDIVISGGCLLHIGEFEKAIAESSRVAREYVVFHRTPVLHFSGTTFYTKHAYGVEMLEIHFNEQQLVRLFAKHGMAVVDVNSHLLVRPTGNDSLMHKTYLCRKTT
jgi:ubiquinone/menaquinone biosynthesis C-methylase UbiE